MGEQALLRLSPRRERTECFTLNIRAKVVIGDLDTVGAEMVTDAIKKEGGYVTFRF